MAPSSRHSRKQEFWGRRRGDGGDPDVEGGKDVSGGGRYTHMTMWAKNPTGLHNLFTLSSLASYEGYYMKPRMDREIISQYNEGVIASTGCPSGEVQTRLRLGQFDEAVEAAAATLGGIKPGDPNSKRTICGPVISARQRDRIQDYLDSAIGEGGQPHGLGEGLEGLEVGDEHGRRRLARAARPQQVATA